MFTRATLGLAVILATASAALAATKVDNVTSSSNDYRVLGPTLVTDPNGNQTAFGFDTLGMLVATAVVGFARTTCTNVVLPAV